MSEQSAILFVGDNTNVLDGLRRTSCSTQGSWRAVFAASGEKALGIMTKRTFVAIVSDLRMPDMGGVELLTKVKERYPQVVRIALSEHAERGTIFCSLKAAHQFLPKQHDPEALIFALSRVVAFRRILINKSLQQLLSQIESLPAFPPIHRQLIKGCQSENISLSQVGDIISQDIGMSAKILQLANSVFCRLPRQISDPAQAVVCLGFDALKSLVLSKSIFPQFNSAKLKDMLAAKLWWHSARVAACAKQIAISEKLSPNGVNESFAAGLLHDIGKLALAANFPDKYKSALDLAALNGMELHEAEREIFGSNHCEVGLYLLGIWGLPDPIVMASGFHHYSIKHHDIKFAPLNAVQIANGLDHLMNPQNSLDSFSKVDYNLIANFGSNGRLDEWKKIYQQI